MNSSFSEHAIRFRQYHNNSLNCFLHLITTPIAIVSFISILKLMPFLTDFGNSLNYFENTKTNDCDRTKEKRIKSAFRALAVLYQLSLFKSCRSIEQKSAKMIKKSSSSLMNVPVVVTGFALSLILIASEYLVEQRKITLKESLVLFALAYFGQELAHIITKEKTYQQSYMNEQKWFQILLQHTYYLLPLCIDALQNMKDSVFGWIVAHDYLLRTKLTLAKEKEALRTIYDFVSKENPARDRTSHWWYEKLPSKSKNAFTSIIDSVNIKNMFANSFRPDAWAVVPIYSMNEIYVASSHHNFNSDTVFYMEHCDGPWSVYPWCFVYRCMVAVNENVQVETIFPMQGSGSCLSDGDVVGFDYHREIHIIQDLPTKNTDRRVTMKLHYVVYPRCFGFVGRFLGTLASFYNWAARNLFLNTIAPKTLLWKFMAFMVLFVTRSVFELERRAGLNTVSACLAAYYIGNKYVHPYFFLVLTSYTHYCMYIATYHVREKINFGTFKRNVMFFKTIALFHLGYNYFFPLQKFEFDLVSLLMIGFGYALSFSAAYALGVDQTYFGVELGKCKPNFVSGFPYNTGIPHPMILGSIVGLLGFHKNASFRENMPYLVPIHCMFYLLHMAQEQMYDIYKKNKSTTNDNNNNNNNNKIGSKTKATTKNGYHSNGVTNGATAARRSPRNIHQRSPAWARE